MEEQMTTTPQSLPAQNVQLSQILESAVVLNWSDLHQVAPVQDHSAFQNLAELDVLSGQGLRCSGHLFLHELSNRWLMNCCVRLFLPIEGQQRRLRVLPRNCSVPVGRCAF